MTVISPPTIMKLPHVHPLIQKLFDKLAQRLNDANVFREMEGIEPLPVAAMMAPLYYYYSMPHNKNYAMFLADLEKAPDFWTISHSNILEDNPKSYTIDIMLEKIFCNQHDCDHISYNPVGYNYRMNFIGNDDWYYLSFDDPPIELSEREWSFSLEKVEIVDSSFGWNNYGDDDSDDNENVI